MKVIIMVIDAKSLCCAVGLWLVLATLNILTVVYEQSVAYWLST